VYYAPGHTKIIKPIIITDGFDPNDKRKLDGLVAGGDSVDMRSGFVGEFQTPNPETIYNISNSGTIRIIMIEKDGQIITKRVITD
jgi:hypothetical protein